ncbi:MAG TPA: aminopeptidase [Chloroflexi bacterium]|nr:MAG: aminopeptidase [Chloroflexota bacterium]HDD55240.1 aminopeptidase [Chloroflexota bacterium]
MKDPRLVKLADLLVNYSVKVQPEEWVLINGHMAAEPLVSEVLRAVLQAGGHPQVLLHSDDIIEYNLRYAGEVQLQWISPATKMLYEQADVLIALRAFDNTRHMSGIDPKKQQLSAQAKQELMQIYMERSASGDLRWTLTQFPCHAYAQDADMSLRDYEDFVYSATYCDKDDPVAEWERIHEEQQKIVDWLNGKKLVTVKSPNADLSLSIEGRTFINSDGSNNMPSGEVFTGPVEDSVNGWVEYTYPAIEKGKEVEGIRLEFKDGKVVKASAEKNEEFLLAMLDSDEGSRYLGEFAIGTNYGIQKFTKSILYDEKIGGSFHMALGAGYPETGSKNVSSIHWDMICDIRQDSEIRVDGELLYKDGKFVI